MSRPRAAGQSTEQAGRSGRACRGGRSAGAGRGRRLGGGADAAAAQPAVQRGGARRPGRVLQVLHTGRAAVGAGRLRRGLLGQPQLAHQRRDVAQQLLVLQEELVGACLRLQSSLRLRLELVTQQVYLQEVRGVTGQTGHGSGVTRGAGTSSDGFEARGRCWLTAARLDAHARASAGQRSVRRG